MALPLFKSVEPVLAERAEEGVPSISVAAGKLMSGCFKMRHDLREAHQLRTAGSAYCWLSLRIGVQVRGHNCGTGRERGQINPWTIEGVECIEEPGVSEAGARLIRQCLMETKMQYVRTRVMIVKGAL